MFGDVGDRDMMRTYTELFMLLMSHSGSFRLAALLETSIYHMT